MQRSSARPPKPPPGNRLPRPNRPDSARPPKPPPGNRPPRPSKRNSAPPPKPPPGNRPPRPSKRNSAPPPKPAPGNRPLRPSKRNSAPPPKPLPGNRLLNRRNSTRPRELPHDSSTRKLAGIPGSRLAQSDCFVVVLTVGKNRQLVLREATALSLGRCISRSRPL